MAIHLSRIYTRTGDGGQTRLVGGDLVSKGHIRLETYGTSDELNCWVGRLRLHEQDQNLPAKLRDFLQEHLGPLQHQLFDLGTLLATPPGKEWENMPTLANNAVSDLEKSIDAMNLELPSLNSFVLPGGSVLACDAHLARTVCRRLERLIARLMETEQVPASCLQFVNRLSDWFFVLARWVLVQEGNKEVLWQPHRKNSENKS